jgi:GNAT superfamily N-acetyltransferase
MALKIIQNKNTTCSARIRFLKWDSMIFGFKIGRIEEVLLRDDQGENRRFLKRVVDVCRKSRYRHLHCRVGLRDIGLVRALESAGFNMADIQVTLTTKGTPPKGAPAFSEKIRIRKAVKGDLGRLKILTRGAFTDTRLVMDPNYPKEGIDRFYYEWVKNSVYNKHQAVFVAEEKRSDRLIGLVICDFSAKMNIGIIDLIAVSESYKNRGAGSALVKFALNWFSGKADKVEVRTQSSNIPAIRTFMKNGLNEFTPGIALPSGISMHRWF